METGASELKFVRDSGWKNLQQICKLGDVDFLLSLTKLSNAGLIKEVVGSYVGYQGAHYIITSTFQRLMSMISYSSEPTFYSSLEQPKI
jgi:hypothetical protein